VYNLKSETFGIILFAISTLAEVKAPLERKNSKLGRRVFSILDKSTCGDILTILEMIRSHFFFFCLDLDLVSQGFRFFVVFFCLILYCLDLDLIRSLCFFVVCVFQIIMDRETGRSRGFLFVTFSNEKLMKDAIEGMNCHSLDEGNITGNRGRQWPRRIQP
jgi:RNA recognition motif-containing protein